MFIVVRASRVSGPVARVRDPSGGWSVDVQGVSSQTVRERECKGREVGH